MSLHSIFSDRPTRRPGPPRPTPSVPSSVAPPLAVAPPPPPRSPDADLLAVLEASPEYGGTIELAFRRKEQSLMSLFSALSPRDALALHARLASPREDDALAARFARLVRERRERLLAFLADARRREAIAAAAGKAVRRG